MKKIFLLTFLLLSINVYGADKAKCEELFRGAIYNFYLENSCKFEKHLSSTIRQKFKDQGCEEMFSDEDMKKKLKNFRAEQTQAVLKKDAALD